MSRYTTIVGSGLVLGNRLAEERKGVGLNQKDLGDLLGLGRSSVAMIETGKAGLDAMRVAGLRSAGFDLDYLLFGEREDRRAGEVLNWELLFAIIEHLNDRCRRKKVRLSPEKVKAIVKHVYLQLVEKGDVDEATLESILRIAA